MESKVRPHRVLIQYRAQCINYVKALLSLHVLINVKGNSRDSQASVIRVAYETIFLKALEFISEKNILRKPDRYDANPFIAVSLTPRVSYFF